MKAHEGQFLKEVGGSDLMMGWTTGKRTTENHQGPVS
jgi:hypothetical protein